MKLKELLAEAENTKFADIEISNVKKDSRKVDKNDAFVCINGVTADGHRFAKSAVENGAAVVICERDLGLENQLVVDDTRKAYALMCAAFFGNPAKKLKIVGVTGTNGKTTTCIVLKSILEHFGHKVGLIGTVQNMIGDEILPAKNTTPDSYELHSLFSLMYSSDCDYVVMEVSSHAIDMKRVYGLTYAACVFTNLTQDHLDYHKTMENYLNVKKSIFSLCDIAVVNADDKYAKDIIEACDCDVVTYSIKNSESTFVAQNICHRVDGVDFEVKGDGVIGRVRFKTPGEFSVYNALAAEACAVALGFPFAGVTDALSMGPKVKGRAEVVPTDRDFTVVIDYAHTPDGLLNIMQTLNKVKEGRLVTVFGCGGDRDKTKRPIMGRLAAENSQKVIVTSDNPRSEDPDEIIKDVLEGMKDSQVPVEAIADRAKAVEHAIMTAQPGDMILLAGKGHETYQVLKDKTIHLDEREIVAQTLKNLK